jgi:hypothetical protein
VNVTGPGPHSRLPPGTRIDLLLVAFPRFPGPAPKGTLYLVEIENGVETIAIAQPADQTFVVGEKVRVYTRTDGAARVAKL